MTEVVIVSGVRTARGSNATFLVFRSQGTRWHWGGLGYDTPHANSIYSYHTGKYSFPAPS